MGFFSFLRAKERPPFMLALYEMDEDVSRLMTRKDVPGLTTFLMSRNGKAIRNATPQDLAAAGMSEEEAWRSAADATRAMLNEVVAGEVSATPRVLLLSSKNSLAMHSILTNWGVRREWTGSLGAVVAFVDKLAYFAAPCDSAPDIEEALNAVVGVATAMACEQEGTVMSEHTPPVHPAMWWADAQGFEQILFEKGELRAGERLRSCMTKM